MKTLRTLLREDDPVERESALSADDVDRIRQMLLAAETPRRSRHWKMRMALAGALSVLAGVAAWHAGWPSSVWQRSDPPNHVARAPINAPTDRRQVQFATPGGTRIIWVFDPHFDVR